METSDPSIDERENETDEGGGMATETANSLTSVEAFEQSLYPLLRMYCTRCHGVNQTPLHSVTDSLRAHDTIVSLGLSNFDDPENSRLVRKVAGGHQGFGMNVAGELRNAVEKWGRLRPP